MESKTEKNKGHQDNPVHLADCNIIRGILRSEKWRHHLYPLSSEKKVSRSHQTLLEA